MNTVCFINNLNVTGKVPPLIQSNKQANFRPIEGTLSTTSVMHIAWANLFQVHHDNTHPKCGRLVRSYFSIKWNQYQQSIVFLTEENFSLTVFVLTVLTMHRFVCQFTYNLPNKTYKLHAIITRKRRPSEVNTLCKSLSNVQGLLKKLF